MVIAALISFENITGSPLWHSLSLLAAKYPDDRFIIFSRSPWSTSATNITTVKDVPRGNALLRLFWYRNTLPRLLKKYKADAFISNTGILSKGLTLAQFIFLDDLFFEEKQTSLFKKNLARSLKEATTIFTTEDLITNILRKKYSVEPGQIITVYHSGGKKGEQNMPAGQVKQKFTGGHDYFLCPADASSAGHVMNLLKAFSLFKKRQRSSMKLVLLLNNIAEEKLVPDFSNYKYRDEVVVVPASEENTASLICNAYALIWLSRYHPSMEAFPAIQHYVPVIVADTDINRELFNDAVLFSDISPASLTEQMQLLYKDETAKNNLSALAYSFIQKYDAAGAAEALYRGLKNHKIR